MGQDKEKNAAESKSVEKKPPKTVVFIPCCGRKKHSNKYKVGPTRLTENDLLNTWENLIEGRNKMSPCNDNSGDCGLAVNLYQGQLYSALKDNWPELLDQVEKGNLRIFVISAGYGIIDIREPIKKYNAVMNGRTANYWKKIGLIQIIGELISLLNPQHVFGYFAGKPDWNNSAKYRYFFTKGVLSINRQESDIKCAGCFYPCKTQVPIQISSSLGLALVKHYQDGFKCPEGNNDEPNIFFRHLLKKGEKENIICYDKII